MLYIKNIIVDNNKDKAQKKLKKTKQSKIKVE